MLLSLLLVLLAPLSLLAAPPLPYLPTRPADNSSFSLNTPLGPASGVLNNGVARFVVKYASSQRFQPSVPSTTWLQGVSSANDLPPACVQLSNVLSGDVLGVEDCLYMILYVPLSGQSVGKGLSVLTWVHGGSFIFGSATAPGLDGSALAISTNSVVAVIQYRLGALGFLPPSSLNANSNLGAKDVLSALKFLSSVVPSFGGDKNQITLAGQSSGGTIVRALLAAPSASSFFQKAIIHSDPMAYGFNTPSGQANLQSAFYENLACSTNDLTCQKNAPLSDILEQQSFVFNNCASIDPSTAGAQPIRIVHDSSFITSTMTGTSLPSVLKPIMLTTANTDAGPAIFDNFGDPLPGNFWELVIGGSFGPFGQNVVTDVLNSTFYPAPPEDAEDIRPELVTLGTDQIWRCPSWTFARSWANKGGNIFTGVFTVGSVYPDATGIPICSATSVCHEGEIETIFGTIPSPTPMQSAAIKEIQARYGSFMKSSNPNGPGLATWSKSSTNNNVNALNIGGTGTAADSGCTSSFFGEQVPYFYQLFSQ